MTPTDQDAPDRSSGIPVFAFFVVVLLVGAFAFFLGRGKPSSANSQQPTVDAAISNPRGKELARTLCASCHQEPSPDIATRDRWAFEILPAKADLLGHGDSTNETVISATDWQAVCNHYLALAPDQLPKVPNPDLPESELFKAVSFNHPTATRMTMGRIDPSGGVIYVGNADDRTIDVITPDGRLLAARPMNKIPLAAAPTADGIYVALSSLADEPDGSVVFLGKPGSGKPDLQVLTTSLNRPADLAVADLNADGQREVVVADARGLLLLRSGQQVNLSTNRFYRALAIADLNADHQADVLAVRSGQQVLEAHLNVGNGRFAATNYAQRHAAWHYSDVVAHPLKQGEPITIITANGSDRKNRRIPLPQIPYHAVRLSTPAKLGDQILARVQNARRIVARDFDGDEDLDIVAIGYSGDHRFAAEHGAVYLEQQRDRSFKVYRLPRSADAFWSDIDAGDVDRDGDPDIVITSYHPGEGNTPEARLKQWEQSPTTLLLLNQTIP